MRFSRLMTYITLIAVFVLATRPSVDTDTWWHLRSGQWMVEHKQILKTDPFSLTRQAQDWIYPGWLSQVVLFTIFEHFGISGMNLFTALMVLAAFWILWKDLEGREILKAFVLLLAAITSGLYWSARPQMFTLVLASLGLFLLEAAKRGKVRGLWFFPALMALWVNVHGGFIIGFILLAVYALGEVIEALLLSITRKSTLKTTLKERKTFLLTLLGVGVISMIACVLNPHGPAILLYPIKTVSLGTLQDYIAEWQSPNFHSPEVQPYLILLFLTFIAFGIPNQRRFAKDFILVTVFGYMSLIAVRNVGLFALVAAPIVSRHFEAGLSELTDRAGSRKELPTKLTRWINFALAVLITLAGLLGIARGLEEKSNLEHIKTQIPLDAFEFIQAHKPQGRLFNSYNWGGYVTWELYPDYLSFVDGRTDLFEDEILGKYLQTWLAEPGWEDYLKEWEINWVLIENNAPLSKALLYTGWEVQYQDEQAIILEQSHTSP